MNRHDRTGGAARLAAGLAAIVLLFLAAERVQAALGLPLPGALLGLLGLAGLATALPGLGARLAPAASLLLSLLGLFLLPLAVDAASRLALMPAGVLARLLAMLAASTVATGLATALLLRLLDRVGSSRRA